MTDVVNVATDEVVGILPGVVGAHGIALSPEVVRGFATAGAESSGIVVDAVALALIGQSPLKRARQRSPLTPARKPSSRHTISVVT